jgi:hypothetical protein
MPSEPSGTWEFVQRLSLLGKPTCVLMLEGLTDLFSIYAGSSQLTRDESKSTEELLLSLGELQAMVLLGRMRM